VETDTNSAGISGDESETGWGLVETDTNSAGMGGDGTNFCPPAGL